jgi:hypothetical protein
MGRPRREKKRANALKGEARFAPINGHRQPGGACPKSAISGLMRRSKVAFYSITSSATASRFAGNSRPSDVAVFRLSSSSNFVGW